MWAYPRVEWLLLQSQKRYRVFQDALDGETGVEDDEKMNESDRTRSTLCILRRRTRVKDTKQMDLVWTAYRSTWWNEGRTVLQENLVRFYHERRTRDEGGRRNTRDLLKGRRLHHIQIKDEKWRWSCIWSTLDPDIKQVTTRGLRIVLTVCRTNRVSFESCL